MKDKFKKGDLVVCVNSDGGSNAMVGNRYIIEEYRPNQYDRDEDLVNVRLVGEDFVRKGYYAWRFRIIKKGNYNNYV